MRLWELDSVFRGSREELLREIISGDQWRPFRDDFSNIDKLTMAQDRARLDRVLPESLVMEALSHLDQKYVIKHNHLMLADEGEPGLSAVEVAHSYGSSIIEDVQEYGSVPIPS